MNKEERKRISISKKRYFREYIHHSTLNYIDIVDGTEESECPSPCQQTKVDILI